MIAIASDHAGFALKNQVIKYLEENDILFKDFGTNSPKSVDYVDFAKLACKAVTEGKARRALLFCGTGIGMSMAANKIHGIRAAVCSDSFSARATRLHNDANALCLGERVVGSGLACELVDIFLATSYEGGRHAVRVQQVMDLEENY